MTAVLLVTVPNRDGSNGNFFLFSLPFVETQVALALVNIS